MGGVCCGRWYGCGRVTWLRTGPGGVADVAETRGGGVPLACQPVAGRSFWLVLRTGDGAAAATWAGDAGPGSSTAITLPGAYDD